MQTSAAISRSAATALTDGGTAKDRHVLPAAATKRFDAILHVIEIVLRDMPNADPATRVALSRLTEALARIVDLPPQPQESLRDFTRRLAAHMDVLPPAARALIEKQLNQQPLLAALKMLVDTLRPALVLDLRIDLPLTRDGLWHPDPVSALFPDEDEQPVFRQPTIQAPLPTRMAFSQAPGVAPGAPHLQQALGQAFSPERTLRAPDAPAPPANPIADAPDPVGNLLQTADEPVPRCGRRQPSWPRTHTRSRRPWPSPGDMTSSRIILRSKSTGPPQMCRHRGSRRENPDRRISLRTRQQTRLQEASKCRGRRLSCRLILRHSVARTFLFSQPQQACSKRRATSPIRQDPMPHCPPRPQQAT